jgi:ribosome-binding factor A
LKSYSRSERIEDLIKREVALVFTHKINDPRLLNITITDVKMSVDLKMANIYYVSNEKKEELTKAFLKVKGFVKREVSAKIKLRRIPEFVFLYDDMFEEAMKIERKIKSIKDDK